MSLKHLWAPWRMEYLTSDKKEERVGCVFCGLASSREDKKNLVVHRMERVFVVLNKYPYNNGHLMVIPYAHATDLTQLEDDSLGEMWRALRRAVKALQRAYRPEGFNIGMNLGLAGGAGIPGHLHLHVIPRWNGDTNFMPLIAETKALPQHLMTSYDQIHSQFEESPGGRT